jgi:hypothetical protein
MRVIAPGLLLITAAACFASQTANKVSLVTNANANYEVEGIEIAGEGRFTLTDSTAAEMNRLVGGKFDAAALDELGKLIRRDLRARTVKYRLARGLQPGYVRVFFEVERRRVDLDVSVPRFIYHSKQGWTGQVEASITYAKQKLTGGLVSDNDEMPERNAGVYGRYEHTRFGSDRLAFRVQVESYHQQWNPDLLAAANAEAALAGPVYRVRQHVQPTVVFAITPELSLESGVSFGHIEPEFLASNAATFFTAAKTESVHSMVNTLRYHRQWAGSAPGLQALDAGYSLRAAATFLSSDFAYTRHRFHGRYSWTGDRHHVSIAALGGAIDGDSPLFERFVLGNSNTLRGWTRVDVAPLGGNRMAHASVEYGYGPAKVFYDTGSVWNSNRSHDVKHSAGIGWTKWGFSLAVAFPLREGRVEPVIIAGMNF